MNFVLAFAFVLTCTAVSTGTTTSHAKKTVNSTSSAKPKTVSARSGSSKSTAHAGTPQPANSSHSKNKHGKASNASLRTGPRLQAAPTPERYQEIQKALAERGFYKGDVNGTWGPDSVEALKQFQTSQNLPNDGKISSLSLIGLGLGPAHAYQGGAVPPVIPVSTSPVGTPSPPTPASGTQPPPPANM